MELGPDLGWEKGGSKLMAHPDTIESLPDLLSNVAREIADLVDQGPEANNENGSQIDGGLGVVETASPLEIGETLTTWSLTARAADEIKDSTLAGDIFDWAEQTPLLYHQIWLDAKPVGFARSLRSRDEKRALAHFNISTVASRVNEAFEMIELNKQNDQVVASDPVVRLLEIPAYHILAIWLFAEDRHESRVVVIDAGKRYQGLERNSFLTSKQFFEALRKGGPILGVA